MSIIDCGGDINQKTYPIANLQVTQCIVATPTPTATPTATPLSTPTPTISSSLCYCSIEQKTVINSTLSARPFLPVVSPTPTNSIPLLVELIDNTNIINNNLLNLSYVNTPTSSSTPAPTPTPILININSIEIDFIASNFSELHIIVDLINKTINVNHAISGPLPLKPVVVTWRNYINSVLQQTKTENWDIPWSLTPNTKKEFLNDFYVGNTKKRVPTIVGYSQWSNQLNIRTKIPITDNINIINATIPNSVKNGNLYIDRLPTAANSYIAIIKLINNAPSPILKDDMWSFTIKVTD